jgi:hypothetical protein
MVIDYAARLGEVQEENVAVISARSDWSDRASNSAALAGRLQDLVGAHLRVLRCACGERRGLEQLASGDHQMSVVEVAKGMDWVTLNVGS